MCPVCTLVQRKVTKRNDTPEPPNTPCTSRRNRRSPNSPGTEQRASGSNTRLASPDSGCDARRRLRGFKKTFVAYLITYITHVMLAAMNEFNDFFIEFQDYLAPKLDVYEQAIRLQLASLKKSLASNLHERKWLLV